MHPCAADESSPSAAARSTPVECMQDVSPMHACMQVSLRPSPTTAVGNIGTMLYLNKYI